MTVTAVTATTVVRRNGPGDVGRDDREHSGRAHQANSRTHTHTQHVHTTLRSLVRSLARSFARPSARVSTRRTKKKRKEETPRKRDPRRHQALRASSLSASSCTTRTYPRIPLGETRRKISSGESALSLARIVSLRVALPSARAHHAPLRRPPLSLPSPFFRQSPTTPDNPRYPLFASSTLSHSPSSSLSCLPIRLHFLSPTILVYPPLLPFEIPRTSSIENF